MKRVVVFLFIFVVFLSCSFGAYADDPRGLASPKQEKILISIKPDITIELDGVKQKFKDANGRTVYPVIYSGSTYLPVRAISGLLNKSIEWDSSSKTVFIGKTLSDPSGTGSIRDSRLSSGQSYAGAGIAKPEYVSAYVKPDILIMYDFVPQSFSDANNRRVYPIIYNGTTYLPVRGISDMMDMTISWDAIVKKVCIEGCDPPEEELPETESMAEDEEPSLVLKTLRGIFEKEELLYYEASSKTMGLKSASSLEEKQQIAAKISENLKTAQGLTLEMAAMDTSSYTEKEKTAFDRTKAFIESTEYYILILENIAYLAAQDSDYSMLAETFLYFAMESQTKMEEARTEIQELK
ncbi:MAG: hypothetical protein PHC91_10000 [Eubacteriales bacterium]|nr:hypothetical protein [Eubacteriales bacterium]